MVWHGARVLQPEVRLQQDGWTSPDTSIAVSARRISVGAGTAERIAGSVPLVYGPSFFSDCGVPVPGVLMRRAGLHGYRRDRTPAPASVSTGSGDADFSARAVILAFSARVSYLYTIDRI